MDPASDDAAEDSTSEDGRRVVAEDIVCNVSVLRQDCYSYLLLCNELTVS